ncbi:MAG: alpha/beta fold hydrolase [Candidatus Omnitrophica bacterium]|nr:alpha/beta fold hydrolase [Candidatus Omnitrophota bacterium]
MYSYDINGTSGEALLFIHGWGIDRRVWRQQMKFFSDQYRVIRADLPGHGETPWEPTDLAKIAAAMVEILRKEQIRRATIIGSSLGGLVGLKIFDIAPQQVQRFVLVGSLPRMKKSEDYPYGLDVEQLRKLEGQLRSDYPSIIQIFFRSLFTMPERSSRRFKWLQRFRRYDASPDCAALIAYLDVIEQTDLRQVFGRLNVPTQIINGSEDSICGLSSMGLLKSLCPGARFDIFERCGHFPFLSHPHQFNDVLLDFLRKTPCV